GGAGVSGGSIGSHRLSSRQSATARSRWNRSTAAAVSSVSTSATVWLTASWCHVHGNDARDTQYSSGGTPTAGSSSAPPSTAARFERSWSTVAAPLSTTSAQGW